MPSRSTHSHRRRRCGAATALGQATMSGGVGRVNDWYVTTGSFAQWSSVIKHRD